MYKAVIFDLDGTLLDTLKDLAISFNHVLKIYNKTPRETEEYKTLIGHGADALLKDILPHLNELELKQARIHFEEHYKTQYNKNTKLYDGISKFLSFLQIRGIKMAVLSNKPHNFTQKCAYKYLSSWHFQEVNGIRENIPKKPDAAGAIEIAKALHVEVKECVFVGDTNVDMSTAKNANMDAIGVLWGFRDKKELLESGAKYIVKNPIEMIKLFVAIETLEKNI